MSSPSQPAPRTEFDQPGRQYDSSNSSNASKTIGAGSGSTRSSHQRRRSSSAVGSGAASSVRSFTSDGRLVFKTRARQRLELFYARLQEVLFDVLYLTTKDNSVYKGLATFGLGFDFLQLLAIALAPTVTIWGMPDFQSGFNIVALPTTRLALEGYGVTFWILSACVFAMIGMALFVAFSVFLNDGVLTQIWVLVTLRFLAGMFVTILYIPTVKVFLSTLDCVDGHWRHHPEIQCWVSSSVQPILAGVSILALVLFVPFSLFVAFMVFDFNPGSKSPLARPNSRLELIYQCLKTLLSATGLTANSMIIAVTLFLTATSMAFLTVHFPPYFRRRTNQWRSGLFTAVSVGAFIMIVAVGIDQESNVSGITFLVQLPASFAVGWFVCHWRINRISYRPYHQHSQASTAKGSSSEVTPMDESQTTTTPSANVNVRKCRLPIYVEMSTRFLETKSKPPDVLIARNIYENALAHFPTNALLHVNFLKFLQAYSPKKDSQFLEIRRQLSRTRHLPKWFDSKFCLFAVRRELEESSQGRNLGEQGMDVMTYVEFKKYHRNATRNTKMCRTWIKRFWKVLYENQGSFVVLSNIVEQVAKYEKKAAKAYERLLHRFPASSPLLRSYGEFMETIFADFDTADQCYDLADELDDQAQQARAKARGHGTSLHSTSTNSNPRLSPQPSRHANTDDIELQTRLKAAGSDASSASLGSEANSRAHYSDSQSSGDSLGTRFRQLGEKRNQHMSPVVRNFLMILWFFGVIVLALVVAWYLVTDSHFTGFRKEVEYIGYAAFRAFSSMISVFACRNVYSTLDRTTGAELVPNTWVGAQAAYGAGVEQFKFAHIELFQYENLKSRDFFANRTGQLGTFPIVEFVPTRPTPSRTVSFRANIFSTIDEFIARSEEVKAFTMQQWGPEIEWNRAFRFIMDNGARTLPTLLLLGSSFHIGLFYERVLAFERDAEILFFTALSVLCAIGLIFAAYWRQVREEVGALKLFPSIPRRTVKELYERFRTGKDVDEADAAENKRTKIRGLVTQKHYMTKVKQSLLRRSLNPKTLVIAMTILVIVALVLITIFGVTTSVTWADEVTAIVSQGSSAIWIAHLCREAAIQDQWTWQPGEALGIAQYNLEEFKKRRLVLAFGQVKPSEFDPRNTGGDPDSLYGEIRGAVNVPRQFDLYQKRNVPELELEFIDGVESFLKSGGSDVAAAMRVMGLVTFDPSGTGTGLIDYYGQSYELFIQEAEDRIDFIWLIFQLIFWLTCPLLVIIYVLVFLVKLGSDLHEETRRTRRMISLIPVDAMNEPEMLPLRTFMERSYVLANNRETKKSDASGTDASIHVDALGSILSCNAAAGRLLGSNEDALVGRNLGDFIKEADFDELGTDLKDMDYDKQEAYRKTHPLGVLKVGGPHLVNVTGKRGRTARVTLYKGVMQMGVNTTYTYVLADLDNVKGRKGQKGHSDKEQLLWHLLELSGDCVIAADNGGKVLFANQAAASFFKTLPTNIIGCGLLTLVEPENSEIDLLKVTEEKVKVKGVDKQGNKITADYTASEVIANGQPVLAIILHSTTAEALTMEQLQLWNNLSDGPNVMSGSRDDEATHPRHAYDKCDYEFENDPVACVTIDEALIIVHLNPFASDLFGYKKGSLRGEGIINIVQHPEDGTLFTDDIDNMVGESVAVLGIKSSGPPIEMTMSIQRASSFHDDHKLYACLFTQELKFSALQQTPRGTAADVIESLARESHRKSAPSSPRRVASGTPSHADDDGHAQTPLVAKKPQPKRPPVRQSSVIS